MSFTVREVAVAEGPLSRGCLHEARVLFAQPGKEDGVSVPLWRRWAQGKDSVCHGRAGRGAGTEVRAGVGSRISLFPLFGCCQL